MTDTAEPQTQPSQQNAQAQQPQQSKHMMTPREKKWIVYDVGNSAFVLLSTAVVPIYANSLLKAAGETNIVSTWGYAQTIASFVITALWWVAFTIPLLTSYKQVHYRATAGQAGEAIRGTFAELGSTFRAIRRNKPLWMFMIAFFFYIDAVNTVISMSTSYGTQLGIDSTQLVVALLVTQFVAFPCSIIYGKLAGRFGSKTMITAAVVAYMCIVFFAAFFLRAALEFWILAILVGMFQGGIQALSRSYYGKIIPKDHANEYYGFYDIFGKTASIIGTFLVATTTSLTGNASIGVLSIAILLAVALVFLLLQKDPTKGSTEAATVD